MKKNLIAALLLLTLTSSAIAGPKPAGYRPWYKDWKNWAILGAAVGSSLYSTHEKTACRQRTDIERCPTGGYGEFRGREVLQGGLSVGLATLSIWGHQKGIKEWPLFGAAATGWNISTGIRNHRVPAGDTDEETRLRKTYSFNVH